METWYHVWLVSLGHYGHFTIMVLSVVVTSTSTAHDCLGGVAKRILYV